MHSEKSKAREQKRKLANNHSEAVRDIAKKMNNVYSVEEIHSVIYYYFEVIFFLINKKADSIFVEHFAKFIRISKPVRKKKRKKPKSQKTSVLFRKMGKKKARIYNKNKVILTKRKREMCKLFLEFGINEKKIYPRHSTYVVDYRIVHRKKGIYSGL